MSEAASKRLNKIVLQPFKSSLFEGSELNQSSEETIQDDLETRRIISEALDCHLSHVSELEVKSLARIVEDFTFNVSTYKDLNPQYKERLLSHLSLDIPLKVVTHLIEDGLYWKRKCQGRWSLCDVKHYGQSWKRQFFERNLENIIETFVPGMTNLACLSETLSLSQDFIRRISITKLEDPVKVFVNVVVKEDSSESETVVEEEVPTIDHINFKTIVTELPNLVELKLSFDERNIDMEAEANLLSLTINDSLQLAQCVASIPQLKVFKLNRSKMDCDRCRLLISHILNHPGLLELDLSHNHIGDRGAKALGRIIKYSPNLQNLIITNNFITTPGAKAIGFALSKSKTLKVLNMRLNDIRDEGGESILKAASISTSLLKINLASNNMGDLAASALGNLFQRNKTVTSVDVSNNKLGLKIGNKVYDGILQNQAIIHLDLRFTDCEDELFCDINQRIAYNKKLKMYFEETDEEIRKATSILSSHRKERHSTTDMKTSITFNYTEQDKFEVKPSPMIQTLNEDTLQSSFVEASM